MSLPIRILLADLIDSLEYIDQAHPDTTGWGVRAERIAQARAWLDEHPEPKNKPIPRVNLMDHPCPWPDCGLTLTGLRQWAYPFPPGRIADGTGLVDDTYFCGAGHRVSNIYTVSLNEWHDIRRRFG